MSAIVRQNLKDQFDHAYFRFGVNHDDVLPTRLRLAPKADVILPFSLRTAASQHLARIDCGGHLGQGCSAPELHHCLRQSCGG
jgi:hypothetical protein